jgi:hypothetical protein
MLTPSPPKTGPKARFRVSPEPTNYDWLFAYPSLWEVKPGYTVQTVERTFEQYMQKVKKWDMEIEYLFQFSLMSGTYQRLPASGLTLEPIATNKSGKMIAASIVGVDKSIYGDGCVNLFAKPTECDTSEAIEILVDIAQGEERFEPEWRKEIDIPGIETLESEIARINDELKKKTEELKSKWRKLDKYRDVFSIHDGTQVEAVQRMLQDIGIPTEKTRSGFPVDLIGKDVAVEVTSISSKIDSSSPKMFQLTQFFEKHKKNEKVILLANTYKRIRPSNRIGKQDFTPPVLDFLRLNNVCAMTSLTLLELWKLAQKDKAKARQLILRAVGELKV